MEAVDGLATARVIACEKMTVMLRFCFNPVTFSGQEGANMHALLFAALLATGAPEPSVEADYATSALGYQALLKGDLALAERQLASSEAANRHDGAWLLNYGHLLAKQGRVNEAREVFRRIARAPDSEVVLASGEVIGTRQASRLAAHRLAKQSLSAR